MGPGRASGRTPKAGVGHSRAGWERASGTILCPVLKLGPPVPRRLEAGHRKEDTPEVPQG